MEYKSRIDKLKKRMYERNAPDVKDRRGELHAKDYDVETAWQPSDKQKMRSKSSSLLNKILIVAGVFLVAAIVFAYISLSGGSNVISSENIDPQDLKVELKIYRNEKMVFNGNSSTKEMKRNVIELVDWLQRSNDLPEVAVLMTGTGIIPQQDFTLKQDDVVEISIEKIGTLKNKISLV